MTLTRKPIIGTSWKMNKTASETRAYIRALLPLLHDFDLTRIDAFLLPPFTALGMAASALAGSGVSLGAQNMHWDASGAWTGEVSASMLLEFGCRYVELGHSERRYHFNETDERINQKVLTALHHDLLPIICIGETAEEKAAGRAFEVVENQVEIALHSVASGAVILAYEPRWAIGGAQAATPDDIQTMHHHLRGWLATRYEAQQAEQIRIIYGGSVNPENAGAIFDLADVDGLFVGRAALDPEGFAELIRIVHDRAR